MHFDDVFLTVFSHPNNSKVSELINFQCYISLQGFHDYIVVCFFFQKSFFFNCDVHS